MSAFNLDGTGQTNVPSYNVNPNMYAVAADNYQFSSDAQEAQKMSQFYPSNDPATGEAVPWWANLATYGVSRAVDAAVGPRMTGSGGQQSTYAGQNGQTYVNGTLLGGMKSDTLLLIGLAALAFYALK